jgi:hypothetical protein
MVSTVMLTLIYKEIRIENSKNQVSWKGYIQIIF